MVAPLRTPKSRGYDPAKTHRNEPRCRQGADPPIFTNSVSTLKLKKVPAACRCAQGREISHRGQNQNRPLWVSPNHQPNIPNIPIKSHK